MLGGSHCRGELGLDENWNKVKNWLTFLGPVITPEPVKPSKVKIKCPEIPTLDNYESDPGIQFWKIFPSKILPSKVHTDIDVKTLAYLLNKRSPLLTTAERLRGARTLDYLKNGANAYQNHVLPCITVKNAKSATKHGKYMTDNVAQWVKAGFVAGPFDTPPCERFRVNAMVAVEQNEKVRPCMNVSLPEGRSMNDNVKLCDVEKVHMSSPRLFGYALREAGKNSVFSKFDMKDAYKNIPAKQEDLRLQGFIWLGKFFVELKQTFGAVASVSNFDIFGNTTQALARVMGNIPRRWCQRQLDDCPVISPAGTDWCENFSVEYMNVCQQINVKLAEDCPKKDKAFRNQTEGKVLGIWFDSKTMEWTLPTEKAEKALRGICEVYYADVASLLTLQCLVGRLNDISLMCPFLSTFRRNLTVMLSSAEESSKKESSVTEQVKNDLLVWWAAIKDCENGLPIPSEPAGPTIQFKKFAICATSCEMVKRGNAAGLGCFGSDEDGEFLFSCSYLWDAENYILNDIENISRSVNFIGMIICIVSELDNLRNQHIVFETENITCSWSWDKQYSKNDEMATILIRCLTILSAYLGSRIHVQYKKWNDSWEGLSAKKLSRRNTQVHDESDSKRLLKEMKIEEWLIMWLGKPSIDWELVKRVTNMLD